MDLHKIHRPGDVQSGGRCSSGKGSFRNLRHLIGVPAAILDRGRDSEGGLRAARSPAGQGYGAKIRATCQHLVLKAAGLKGIGWRIPLGGGREYHAGGRFRLYGRRAGV